MRLDRALQLSVCLGVILKTAYIAGSCSVLDFENVGLCQDGHSAGLKTPPRGPSWRRDREVNNAHITLDNFMRASNQPFWAMVAATLKNKEGPSLPAPAATGLASASSGLGGSGEKLASTPSEPSQKPRDRYKGMWLRYTARTGPADGRAWRRQPTA